MYRADQLIILTKKAIKHNSILRVNAKISAVRKANASRLSAPLSFLRRYEKPEILSEREAGLGLYARDGAENNNAHR